MSWRPKSPKTRQLLQHLIPANYRESEKVPLVLCERNSVMTGAFHSRSSGIIQPEHRLSLWEKTLICNAFSHWPSSYPERYLKLSLWKAFLCRGVISCFLATSVLFCLNDIEVRTACTEKRRHRVEHILCQLIWARSQNCGCLVTWFCYQLIAKPDNRTAAVSWSDPSNFLGKGLKMEYVIILYRSDIYILCHSLYLAFHRWSLWIG